MRLRAGEPTDSGFRIADFKEVPSDLPCPGREETGRGMFLWADSQSEIRNPKSEIACPGGVADASESPKLGGKVRLLPGTPTPFSN